MLISTGKKFDDRYLAAATLENKNSRECGPIFRASSNQKLNYRDAVRLLER
jgi:hypothetical protein